MGKIYVIDLDKTLVEGDSYTACTAIPGRVDKINALYDQGHTIIIYTARGATTGINWFKDTYRLLESIGLRFTELRMGKFNYDVWVDDKAVNDKDFFNEC